MWVIRPASLIAAIACIISCQSVVRVSHSMPDAPVSETSPAFPSFMFEGLRSGEMRRFPSPVPMPAGWQNVISEAGVIDVQHIPQPYRAMPRGNLHQFVWTMKVPRPPPPAP